MNLDGAVVLITGGGDGIGFACAQELLQCGCRVSVVDVLETSATGTCGWRIDNITPRLAFGTTLDSASATGTNQAVLVAQIP